MLLLTDDSCSCGDCGKKYGAVSGIPDLRDPASTDPVTAADRADARKLAFAGQTLTPEEMVREFFGVREGIDGWSEADTHLRVRQTLAAPARLRADFDEWLKPVTAADIILDVGCGLGGLLTAAAMRGQRGAGIDNRLSALVVAKAIIEQHGGTAMLACAEAEKLPLANNSVGAVVMHDVVEHIMDLDPALREVSRVTADGGVFACATPNRYSIAPEPHVHLFGVGWLPRKYQVGYVRRRIGFDYRGTQLKSASELLDIVKRNTAFDAKAYVAPIPDTEIEAARGMRKMLARGYNFALKNSLARKVSLYIGPFYHVTGVKRSQSPDIRNQIG